MVGMVEDGVEMMVMSDEEERGGGSGLRVRSTRGGGLGKDEAEDR